MYPNPILHPNILAAINQEAQLEEMKRLSLQTNTQQYELYLGQQMNMPRGSITGDEYFNY